MRDPKISLLIGYNYFGGIEQKNSLRKKIAFLL
jgi:hypothetical protein